MAPFHFGIPSHMPTRMAGRLQILGEKELLSLYVCSSKTKERNFVDLNHEKLYRQIQSSSCHLYCDTEDMGI